LRNAVDAEQLVAQALREIEQARAALRMAQETA
jgi:hypothetical protein